MVPLTCTRLANRLASCFVPHKGNGRLWVFEGVPGAGKTTAIQYFSMASDALVVPQLDHTLEREEIAKDRVQRWYLQAELERQALIRTTLATSTDVFQDRNILSTLAFAYASARRFGVRSHIASVLKMVLRGSQGLLVRPDVLVVLTVDPIVGLHRRRLLAGEPLAEVWRDKSFLAYHAAFYTEFISAFPADIVSVVDTTELALGHATSAVYQSVNRKLTESRQ